MNKNTLKLIALTLGLSLVSCTDTYDSPATFNHVTIDNNSFSDDIDSSSSEDETTSITSSIGSDDSSIRDSDSSYYEDEQSSNEDETSEQSSSIEEEQANTFNDFLRLVEESKPTKAQTVISYRLVNEDVTLTFNSTVIVEYGEEIKVQYSYMREHLNPIGSDSFIGTDSGAYVYMGSSVYEIKDGISYSKDVPVESSFTFGLSVNFIKSYFDSCEIDEYIFEGLLKDSKVNAFFGNSYGIRDVSLILVAMKDMSKLSRVSMSYTSSLNAEVTINTYYSYNSEKVGL